jgi:hypothetical protein
MTLTEFRSRPLTTRTYSFCDECEQLREDPDVRERVSYWPIAAKYTCCAACFAELAGALQGVVVC